MMDLVDSMLRELERLRMEVWELKERFANFTGFFELSDEEYNAIRRKMERYKEKEREKSGSIYGFNVEISDDVLKSLESIDAKKIINSLKRPFASPYERLKRCNLYRTKLGNYNIIYCVEDKTVLVLNVSLCQDRSSAGGD